MSRGMQRLLMLPNVRNNLSIRSFPVRICKQQLQDQKLEPIHACSQLFSINTGATPATRKQHTGFTFAVLTQNAQKAAFSCARWSERFYDVSAFKQIANSNIKPQNCYDFLSIKLSIT